MPNFPDILSALLRHEELSRDDALWAMGRILSGEATNVQIAGFVVALRSKGETVGELTALADEMIARATPITVDREAVDVVGTGGDRANTVNVSTMASIVAAGAGAKVVKHGNRAASSACGTADVLEALGVALDVPAEKQAEVLDEVGIVFLFAPRYHASLRFAGPTRSELAIPTSFNLLGPLANPARPYAQAVGVADGAMAPLVAGVLAGRGSRGMVFHGGDGLDELTTTTTSDVWVFGGGDLREDTLDPSALGLTKVARGDLVGGPAEQNAGIVRDVLGGKPGAVRDIVLLNAAAALVAYHGPDERPIQEQIGDKLPVAAESIDSGDAASLLDRWVVATSARAAG